MRLLLIFLLLVGEAQAEIVYVTPSARDATLRIYATPYRTNSCHVFVTTSRTEARNRTGVWFFTSSRSEATIRVYYDRSGATGARPVFFSTGRTDTKCPD